MSVLSFIFANPRKAKIGVMELDASISESHERSTTITENEVEDGAVISDHAKLNPIKLNLEALISDSPLTLFNSIAGLGASTLASRASGLVGTAVSTAASFGAKKLIESGKAGSVEGIVSNNRTKNPEDAYKYLCELWANRTPFTVQTALQKYDNMMIENLSIPRTANNGKSLRFSVSLKQITIVESAVVKVPALRLDKSAKSGGSSAADLGKQASKAANEKTSSVAFKLLKGFTG